MNNADITMLIQSLYREMRETLAKGKKVCLICDDDTNLWNTKDGLICSDCAKIQKKMYNNDVKLLSKFN